MKETVIVRNTCVKSLYDVVRVDYMKEEVEWVAKALPFEEAVAMIDEVQTVDEDNIEQESE